VTISLIHQLLISNQEILSEILLDPLGGAVKGHKV